VKAPYESMLHEPFPRDRFVEFDLTNPCLVHEYKHLKALLNSSAIKVLENNNFTKLYYFYMHACIAGYYTDRFFNHYRAEVGDKNLHCSEALILDCSLEGDYQVDYVIERVCTELGAQRYQVIVVSQSGAMGVPQTTVFYNQAHYDVVSDKSRSLIDTAFQNRSDSIKDFICLNNMPRPHRISLVAYLYSKGLHADNIISYTSHPVGGSGGHERSYNSEHYITSALSEYSSLEKQIHLFINDAHSSGLGISESNDVTEDVATSAGTPWDAYVNSKFSIVTESDFTSGVTSRYARVTEKVYKSIAVGHPFILAGNAESLKHLKELGFLTFAPFINEDYDDPGSLDERMLRVCNSIDLLLSDLHESIEIYESLTEVSSFNREHLMSGGLQKKVVSLYNTTLAQYFACWRE
jgi:hypothetical protein